MTDFSYQHQAYGTQAPVRDTTAVMGRRILAWFVDLLIYLGLAVALFATFAEYVEIPPGVEPGQACEILQDSDGNAASGCFNLDDRAYITSADENGIQTLAAIGYFIFFVVLQGVTGGSPGKLLTGLRVVNEQGERAGVGKSLVRSLLWIVDAAPWIVPLVGPIVGLTSTGHRRVGDMVAKTYVISAKDVGTPVVTSQGAVPPGAQPWGAPPPAAGWGPPSQPPTQSPTAPGTPVDPTVPESVVPDVSGVPGDTPAPPTTSGISQQPAWEDPAREPHPPPDVDHGPTVESSAPADESPPDVGADPEWWSGLESSPEHGDTAAHRAADADEPEPITWEDPSPSPETTPADEGADEGWVPPTTPNADFGTTDDASPTAGPTPFVAPGTDTRAEAPTTPQANPTPPPQWDQARNTYIQWEPNQQTWLQWDTVANRWKLIDT